MKYSKSVYLFYAALLLSSFGAQKALGDEAGSGLDSDGSTASESDSDSAQEDPSPKKPEGSKPESQKPQDAPFSAETTQNTATQDNKTGTPPNQKEDGNQTSLASTVPSGKKMININFPEPTEIKDIIKAVSIWTGRNVILDKNVSGKIQIISPAPVTPEAAYQAFLSALNMVGFTTVETGQMIKIMKIQNAVKDNLSTYVGSSYAPRTDNMITQVIPLTYVDAKSVQNTLSRMVDTSAMIAYEPTNTLIVSGTGNKIYRILEIINLLDVKNQQPELRITPVKHSDPKSITDKVNQILQSANKGKPSGGGLSTFKILTDERTNSIAIFGSPKMIQEVENLVRKFDIPVEDPSTVASIHVRPLDFADAKKLASTLSALVSGGKNQKTPFRRPPMKGESSGEASVADLGDGVKISPDESNNSLLITGSKNAYNAINALIRKLDIRRSQVFIEADILDLEINNGFNFGTSIFAGTGNKDASGTKSIIGWQGKNMGPLVVAGSTANSGGTVPDTVKTDIANTFSSDMTIGILAGQSINVPGLGSFTPGGLINLLKTDTNSKVLASPHILTANNEEANISVGQRIYFQSNSSVGLGSAASVVSKPEKEDADLSLTIKPNISQSDYVTLTMTLDSSDISGYDAKSNLPIISKRKSKQTVTVKDKQTVVISGLSKQTKSESYSKIPLLGDIPVLGWLFRNSSIKDTTKELMVFLTPYTVHGPEDLAAIYQRKVAARDEYMRRMSGRDFKDDEFYKKLPTQEAGVYKASSQDLDGSARQGEKQEISNAVMHLESGNSDSSNSSGFSQGGESMIAPEPASNASSQLASPTPDMAPPVEAAPAPAPEGGE